MSCNPEIFEDVPLFAMLDHDERAVLAEQVEIRKFSKSHRIFKAGDPGGKAFIVTHGKVSITVMDSDNREVMVHEADNGDVFGLSSMLAQDEHQTTAVALDETTCIELDRNDLQILITKKPMAGLDMLAMVEKQLRNATALVRERTTRNPNEVIAEKMTVGDKVADAVAKFGGSWRFIGTFFVLLMAWVVINTLILKQAFDPFPFILLNLFLSMLASIQAPVIMMSQNRQDAKDRLRSELDYNVNVSAERGIAQLLERVNRIEDRLDVIMTQK
ncbi:MAG TPA: DUF1003 domain-containing protein [Thermoflexales bacterium]|nr:DUF1003 domain-containing protein [Thermoflexales bacterium]HQW34385.1 DUF1003 domain-containing protein [Thermoflexales bacterium]HQZ21382.1 DUF1003 domain-containing protein [Thermoflexales bacterium]HQZ99323.1 DUF1003 domain-containing protein [Thermoflexales bacterium]